MVAAGAQQHKDKPRAEVIEQAEVIIRESHDRAKVYFKFTCEHCGQRCTLTEANTLPEKGECFLCGHETELTRAGFMLVLEMSKEAREAGGRDYGTA